MGVQPPRDYAPGDSGPRRRIEDRSLSHRVVQSPIFSIGQTITILTAIVTIVVYGLTRLGTLETATQLNKQQNVMLERQRDGDNAEIRRQLTAIENKLDQIIQRELQRKGVINGLSRQ